MTIRNEPPKEKRLYADDIWKARYEELSARLDALEDNQAPAKPVVDKPWPQDGDEYWYLDPDGDVIPTGWDTDHHDLARLGRGAVFRTRKETEKADQLCLAMNELKVAAEKDSGPGHKNFLASYSDVLGEWKVSFHNAIIPGAVYFQTESLAVAAYKAVDAKYEGVLR